MTARSESVPAQVSLYGELAALVAGVTGGAEPLILESLEALRLKSAIDQRFGIDFPLAALFELDTLTDIADVVRDAVDSGGGAEQPLPVTHDARARFDPFPLTTVQQAYWLGASNPDLGGRSAHFYLEIDFFSVSARQLSDAFNQLIQRHDMLRAVLTPDGRQCVRSDVGPYRVEHTDLSGAGPDEQQSRLDTVREILADQVFDPRTWPLYDVRTHDLGEDRIRLHLSIDLLIADATSIQLLVAEWIRLVLDSRSAPAALELSFRDVVLAANAREYTPGYQRARRYWLDRIPSLPAAPQLPVRAVAPGRRPRFVRRQERLSASTWDRLRARARALRTTPSMLLCAAYAEVLRVWSASAQFTLNLTLADRPVSHPDILGVIGDFTRTVLVECDLRPSPNLAATAAAITAQVRAGLANAQFDGVLVQRELARLGDAARARMPIVFTSLLTEPDGLAALEDVVFSTGYAISQTPQVLLDNQVLLRGGDLLVSWDAVAEAFPDGLLEDMFRAYLRLLSDLAESGGIEYAPVPVRPPRRQLEVRAAVNDTGTVRPDELIHAGIERQIRARPDAPAVITTGETLSFHDLDRRANQVAHWLRRRDVAPGELVGVVMSKGWQQVVAVLGIARAGAAYLSVDAQAPQARIEALLEIGAVRLVLTEPDVTSWASDLPEGPVEPPATTPGDLAYVIFTSGSTGRPKGVMISHGSAVNTLADVNERLHVGEGDRVLGVSSLSFDLSVYDVFGVLGAGGAVVLPAPEEIRDPAALAELADRYRITLWNSVPPLLELLVEHCERANRALPASLRTVLLSGDWIPLSLSERVIAASAGAPLVYGLGGATEAAIWSVWQPITRIDPGWRSVPYGVPLRNQTCRVLDSRGEAKPDLVPGELYIGGAGVALGYWADPETTARSFRTDPDTGERLYRTGDIARYWADGTLEFHGRLDNQVKVGGHRIELGEIEAVLGTHPGVRSAVVTAAGPAMGPKRLVGYVVPAAGAAPRPARLKDFLAEQLPSYLVPAVLVVVEDLPLGPNGKLDRAALPEPTGPESSPAPEGPAEQRIAEIWTRLLGVDRVGRGDDFFALGGDSLLVVRAVAGIAAAGLRLTAGEFYQHPTVAGQARIARARPPSAPATTEFTGPIGLTPSQHWFFANDFAAPEHWNGMWPVFALSRPLDTGVLSRALALVIAAHDALRTRFRRSAQGWRAEIVDRRGATAPVATISLRDVPDADLDQEIGRHVANRNGALNLADGPVVLLTYFDLGASRPARLLISAHWLVMDYYSSRIFYEDLRIAYFALERGNQPVLAPPTASLPACLAQLDDYARSPELAAEIPYWHRIARTTPVPLPVDHRRGPNTQQSADRLFVRATGATAEQVIGATNRRHLLIAALVRTVAAWTGRPELLIELEGHGREHAFGELDVSRTVARFSTVSPALLRTGDAGSIQRQIESIPRGGVGFGVLRYLHPDPAIRAALAPAPEVGFNFWGEVSEYFTDDAWPVVESFGYHRSDLGDRPRVLDLTALTVGGELWLVWHYSRNLHTEATIQALADAFTAELAVVAEEIR